MAHSIEVFRNILIRSDGYINATALCKQAGKLLGHWSANRVTKEFLAELSTSIGIPIDLLVQSVTTGLNEYRGSWVHPRVALHLAQWLSPSYAVMVTEVLEKYHAGKLTTPQLPDFTNPVEAARAWANEFEQKQELQAKKDEVILELEAAKPKVDGFDRFANAEGFTTLGTAGRLLGIGQNRLFKKLKDDSILMKNNLPYQRYLDSRYFVVKSLSYVKGQPYPQTFLTPKGIAWLSTKYPNTKTTMTVDVES